MTEINTIPESLETYENRIDQSLEDFCLEYGIEDLKKESQSVFSAAMTYIYRRVFKPLKPKELNCKCSLDYREDLELLLGICDHYIFICNLYSKVPSIKDFARLTGLSYDTIARWKDDYLSGYGDKVSKIQYTFYKILSGSREEGLANLLIDGKRNPVGVLGVLNHQFGWATERIIREESKPRLSSSELLQNLPQLPENPQSIGNSGDEKIDIAVSKNANEDTFFGE